MASTSGGSTGAANTPTTSGPDENPPTPVKDTSLEKGVAVDPRLDNRTGTERPKRTDFPAVPQQVDGPDIAHQKEFTKRYLDNLQADDAKDRLGMASPGPHGLSDLKQAEGHDRAKESGGKAAKNGEEGSPIVGKAEAQGSQR